MAEKNTKKKIGRPPKLEFVNLGELEAYAGLGLSNQDIALLLKVSVDTLDRKKGKDDTFAEAIKRGQAKAKGSVTKALFDSARGGNITAQIFWLCNRASDEWQNVQKIENEHKGRIKLEIVYGKNNRKGK